MWQASLVCGFWLSRETDPESSSSDLKKHPGIAHRVRGSIPAFGAEPRTGLDNSVNDGAMTLSPVIIGLCEVGAAQRLGVPHPRCGQEPSHPSLEPLTRDRGECVPAAGSLCTFFSLCDLRVYCLVPDN